MIVPVLGQEMVPWSLTSCPLFEALFSLEVSLISCLLTLARLAFRVLRAHQLNERCAQASSPPGQGGHPPCTFLIVLGDEH